MKQPTIMLRNASTTKSKKKDMQLWFVSNIDRMEIEITETRRMNIVSRVELFPYEPLTTTSLLTP